MSKWEDSFKKTTDSCFCQSSQGLFVPNRQLSALVALLLFLFFACFMTGYFLGKKQMVAAVSHTIIEELHHDQEHNFFLKDDVTLSDGDDEIIETNCSHHNQENDGACALHEEPSLLKECETNVAHYYAQLIGFGTEKAASQFVQKLALKNIETIVKKHTSKTAKGRIVHWYQVVTPVYSNRSDLELIVSRLEKEERLKDTCISTC